MVLTYKRVNKASQYFMYYTFSNSQLLAFCTLRILSVTFNEAFEMVFLKRGNVPILFFSRSHHEGRACCFAFAPHWIFILLVCPFIVAGVAGTCAGQSLPCPVLRRPPEAGQPPVVPPQQQRVQLPGPHRKLLRQDTYVSPGLSGTLSARFVCFVCERFLKCSASLPSSRASQRPVHEPRPPRPLP